MVKTRLSKVLAMLLALTMVLSTMVIDFTAFAAANADVDFTVTAVVDDADYNKGETVTVKYYAKAAAETEISSYQFKIPAVAGLELTSLVGNLGESYRANTATGKIAWANSTENEVKILADDTLIATATFTAIHETTAQNVAISATDFEITPTGYDANIGDIDLEGATVNVNLWNITVTFSGDEGIENNVAGTAYVKYGEAGLYKDTTYLEAYAPVEAEAKDTYR